MALDPNSLNLPELEKQHGLPAGLLSAVMKAESGGNPNAVSPKGAQGLFQFMPATAKAYGVNPFDPNSAAIGAARMYGDLSKQFKGDVPSMLAAYNWGSGNLTKNGLQNAPKETQDYIAKILPSINGANLGSGVQMADSGQIMNDAGAQSNNTIDVEMPDGTIIQGVPQGITQAQLTEMLNGKVQSPLQKFASQGYMERVSGDITNAANKTASILTEGTRNPLSAAIQIGGQGASIAAAPIVQAGVGAFRSLPQSAQDTISSAASSVANKIEGGIGGIADYLDTTKVGQAFGDYAMDSPNLQANMNEVSDTAKAAANIALTLSPSAKINGVTAASKIGKPVANVVKKTGTAIRESGEASANAAKNSFAADLYTPKLTPKVIQERAANTVATGANQKPVYVAPKFEADAIKTLQELPIKKTNTLQKNYNIVANEVKKSADALSETLAKTPVKYKADAFKGKLDDALTQLKSDPLIIGDGEKVAERVFSKMKELAAKNMSTPRGALKTRQQFDAWARSKKGSVFDANDTAFSAAVKQARNTTNDFISDIAPNADVKAALLRQSQLLEAMDNMATKIPSAPKTRLGMAAKKVGEIVPDSGAGKLAGVTALGALGWTAPSAVAGMAGLSGAGYGAYKLATSPAVRKIAGKTIEVGSGLVEPVISVSPLAAFGEKFNRKVTNKPLKVTITPQDKLPTPEVNLP
jgi:hypothetical protein